MKDDTRSVLVTGASSGIGKAIAAEMSFAGSGRVRDGAERGGCRRTLKALGMPNLVPILFDLRRLEDLPLPGPWRRSSEAGEPYVRIDEQRLGQHGRPIELMNLERFSDELRARLVGAVALVQAFLPSLRRSGGRILWIATPGMIPTPYVTGIHAADFAVNCIVRTLAIELGRTGPAGRSHPLRRHSTRAGSIRSRSCRWPAWRGAASG